MTSEPMKKRTRLVSLALRSAAALFVFIIAVIGGMIAQQVKRESGKE